MNMLGGLAADTQQIWATVHSIIGLHLRCHMP